MKMTNYHFNMLKVSTFCSGIGSPEMALKNLGIEHEVVLTAEIDKYARQTYLANHSTKKMINDMTVPDYEGEEYYADINISGLPCQAFSLAGKRLGELDPRGLLFFDFYRYVKNQKPKYFIIENVKGLLSDNNGNTFRNWINLLGQSENGNGFFFPHEDSLTYNLHWTVLNSKYFGVPQNRERVFLVGLRNDLPNDFVFPKGERLTKRLKDVLEENVEEKYFLSDKLLSWITSHREKRESSNKFPLTENDISGCLTARYHKCGAEDIDIGAIRGRNPDKPNDRTTGAELQQTLEINQNGTSNCLTSVQKDNLVVEKVIQLNPSTESGGVQPYQQNRIYDSEGIAPALCRGKSDLNVTETFDYPRVKHQLTGGKWDKTHEQSGRVYNPLGIAPTIHTMQGGNQEPKIINEYRIRKLTPKECFRLQGFSDEFYEKAVKAGVSSNQLYKQAGNSITVNVMQAILKNLLKNEN